MANSAGPLKAGYGNGGIASIEQFGKLADKIGNSLKNLEFTRDMLRQLADNEKKSAKVIAQILNSKSKSLRFSVVDQAIQNYWRKQETNRRHFATALQTKIVDALEVYISSARDKKKKLSKENGKIQKGFTDVRKETTKQKGIALREWQKLEEQIGKNEGHTKANKLSKVRDLKPLQEKCSKAFKKYEALVTRLNELEQANHGQACEMGQLLHESQKCAAERLSMHYNMAVSSKKFCEEFIAGNKSIVQSRAPPVSDILWRWVSYPKNHQTHSLPCTSKEVSSKQAIGQSFKRRVESDLQKSQFLKPPKAASPKRRPKSPPDAAQPPSAADTADPSSSPTKREKKKKSKKGKHKKAEVVEAVAAAPEAAPAPAPADDNWDVDFGGDDGGAFGNGDANATDGAEDVFASSDAVMSTEDFFGASNGDAFGAEPEQKGNESNDAPAQAQTDNAADFDFGNDGGFGFDDGNADIFGSVQDTKQAPVEAKVAPKQKDLVEEHAEEAAVNGFDAAFDDDFAATFQENEELAIAQGNAETDANLGVTGGAGFEADWNTNFDENAFADDGAQTADAAPEDVDQMFADSMANDLWATPAGPNTQPNVDSKANAGDAGDALFADDFGGAAVSFGGDDIFGDAPAAEPAQNPKKAEAVATPTPPAMDDAMFGGSGANDFDFGATQPIEAIEAIEAIEPMGDTNGINIDMGSADDFDDEFDDGQALEFPEYDGMLATATTSTSTKKRKSASKAKQKQKQKALVVVEAPADPQSSPQPNQITSIPEPVISFDAPEPSQTEPVDDALGDDNPFGDDPFGAGDMDGDDVDDEEIGGDNPFAMFEEPSQTAGGDQSKQDDEFDPFG